MGYQVIAINKMTLSLRKLRRITETLPAELQGHLERVSEVAIRLAERHKIDPLKVELASLGHDIYRAHDEAYLLSLAKSMNVHITPIEEYLPIMLHGPLAAIRIQEECDITDSDILQAVKWHTTSCPGIGKVGLIVFLADKIEPEKLSRAEYLAKIAKIAEDNLESAALRYLTEDIAWRLRNDSLVHPAAIEARNYLLTLLS